MSARTDEQVIAERLAAVRKGGITMEELSEALSLVPPPTVEELWVLEMAKRAAEVHEQALDVPWLVRPFVRWWRS